MNDYLATLGISVLALFLYMSAWAGRSIAKKRSDMADQAWGLGFVLIALINMIVNRSFGAYLLVVILVSVWGLRLFWHIYRRHQRSEEDRRYQELVDSSKSKFKEIYLKVFMFQGFLMLLVALPLINSGYYRAGWDSLGAINVFGILLWLVGFFFEAVGDKQLRDFLDRSENKGKIMTEGLWAYTRHPNYFGEILMWWGLFIYTFQLSAPWLWAISVIGPLTISYLLIFVSGIPMAEKCFLEREDYKQYAKSTSALVPWFKK